MLNLFRHRINKRNGVETDEIPILILIYEAEKILWIQAVEEGRKEGRKIITARAHFGEINRVLITRPRQAKVGPS